MLGLVHRGLQGALDVGHGFALLFGLFQIIPARNGFRLGHFAGLAIDDNLGKFSCLFSIDRQLEGALVDFVLGY